MQEYVICLLQYQYNLASVKIDSLIDSNLSLAVAHVGLLKVHMIVTELLTRDFRFSLLLDIETIKNDKCKLFQIRFHTCFDHIEQRACYCPGGQGNNRGSSSHLFHLFSVHSRLSYNHVCVQL